MSAEILLRVDGEVFSPRDLTMSDLAAVDSQHQIPDVSQIEPSRQGCAVTLEGILALVQPKPAADYLTLHASADNFHASVPLASVRERGFFIYQVDGAPLQLAAGH